MRKSGEATVLPKLEDIIRCRRLRWLDIFHEWITIDFHDKLSYGNRRVSGGGQVDHDRTGEMLSRKI